MSKIVIYYVAYRTEETTDEDAIDDTEKRFYKDLEQSLLGLQDIFKTQVIEIKDAK